jgi:hypothetical protein
MSKESILKKLSDLEDQNLKFNEHVLICIEADDNGIPVGSAVKVKGTPYMTLGMIDLAMHKLQEARDSILDKFETVEQASRAINELPKDVVDKIRKFEEEARDAMQRGDIAKLEQLKDEAKNLLGLDMDDENRDESGFNINDFKG